MSHKKLITLDLQTDSVPESKIGLKQLLAHHLQRPDHIAPVSLEDMEQAIQHWSAFSLQKAVEGMDDEFFYTLDDVKDTIG